MASFDYDVIIIGSGFGGAIAAKRFTAAGHTVTLLELGEESVRRSAVQPAFQRLGSFGEAKGHGGVLVQPRDRRPGDQQQIDRQSRHGRPGPRALRDSGLRQR